MNKEKQFTSYDSQGPTDIDVVGLHLDTIEDIFKLIQTCQDYDNKKSRRNPLGLDVTYNKLDELKHYTFKLKQYIKR
tara:strand:- start:124 stop:354 length:231 start_codon:yes stop_codon:yes gene_type:complete